MLKLSSNYSDTTGSLRLYTKDKAIDFDAYIADTNVFKSFKYKSKLIGSTAAANRTLEDAAIVSPLKNLSNFWRSLEIHDVKSNVYHVTQTIL